MTSLSHDVSIRLLDDKGTWELFALTYGPYALFQSWSWYETLLKSKEDVTPYGVYAKNELVAIFLAHVVRARRGSYIHLRHGPIVSSKVITDVYQDIAVFTKALAIEKKCWFVRMSPQLPVGAEAEAVQKSVGGIPASIHRMDGEYCWVLDLTVSEEQLLKDMRKATRYEIRKAEKDGVKITASRDAKYLKAFDSLYKETSGRHGFVPHEGIKEEFMTFSTRNQAMLYLGEFEKKTYAAAIILYYGKQAIYHHGASIHSTVPVSASVQWQAIRDAKNRGMNVYNFWGIAPEDSPKHPWRGITVFKKGFGGHLVEYMHAFDIPVTPLYRLTRVVDLVRKYKRGYD